MRFLRPPRVCRKQIPSRRKRPPDAVLYGEPVRTCAVRRLRRNFPRVSVLQEQPQMQNEASTSGLPDWLRIAIMGRSLKRTLIRAALLAAGIYFVAQFVLLPRRVDGPSMLPTYPDHSVVFVNRLAYLRHGPQRGDVVFVRMAGLSVMYMKRVIGLPGETVAFAGGHALIDGQVLDEPYVKFRCYWNHDPIILGPDEYYVVGDNRSMRWDDHEKGVAPRRRIVGRILK